MADSQLVAIYQAIEDMSVTFASTVYGGNKTPAVLDIDEIDPTTIQSGNLPLRLLLPYAPDQQGQEMQALTFGGSGTAMTWNIVDMLLLASTSYGRGLVTATPDLVKYMVAYLTQVRANISIAGGTVIGFKMAAGAYRYPNDENAAWYYGVLADWRIKELIA